MDPKLINKIFDLVMRGDKKSIARAQELISNNEIDCITDVESNKQNNNLKLMENLILPYINDNGDPDIRSAIETLKMVQDINNLKMVRALISKRITDLRYSDTRKKQVL